MTDFDHVWTDLPWWAWCILVASAVLIGFSKTGIGNAMLLSVVWPALEAVLEEAVAEPKLPAGLPDLIRVLRLNPAAIPSVPAAIRQLASRKGSGQALAEARALVEARPE